MGAVIGAFWLDGAPIHGARSLISRAIGLDRDQGDADEDAPAPVAVKIPYPAFQEAPSAREAFIARAELLTGLDTPRLIPVLRSGQDQRTAYVVTPWLQGRNLEALVSSQTDRRLPLRATLSVGLAVADVLRSFQVTRVVHGGLRPSKVLISRSGEVWVQGCSGVGLPGDVGDRLHHAEDMAWLAPEQLAGRPLGPETDTRALVLLLVTLLSGRQPYLRPTVEQTAEAIRYGVQLSLPMVPTALLQAITEELSTARRLRSGDARTLYDLLDALLGPLGGPLTAAEWRDTVSQARAPDRLPSQAELGEGETLIRRLVAPARKLGDADTLIPEPDDGGRDAALQEISGLHEARVIHDLVAEWLNGSEGLNLLLPDQPPAQDPDSEGEPDPPRFHPPEPRAAAQAAPEGAPIAEPAPAAAPASTALTAAPTAPEPSAALGTAAAPAPRPTAEPAPPAPPRAEATAAPGRNVAILLLIAAALASGLVWVLR